MSSLEKKKKEKEQKGKGRKRFLAVSHLDTNWTKVVSEKWSNAYMNIWIFLLLIYFS